jgi:hypothetical protein
VTDTNPPEATQAQRDDLIEKAARVLYGWPEGPHPFDRLNDESKDVYRLRARALDDAGLLADPEQAAILAKVSYSPIDDGVTAAAKWKAERDLLLWLHAEAAWRVAGLETLTVHLARINGEFQARIDKALAELGKHVPAVSRGAFALRNARDNHKRHLQRTIAALQGDQSAEPTSPQASTQARSGEACVEAKEAK